MNNLIIDPEFLNLEQLLKEDAGISDLSLNLNIISNGYDKIENYLSNAGYSNLSNSLSNLLLFKKVSSNSTKDSIKLSKLLTNKINNALMYTSLDTSATLKKIYFPIDSEYFNLQNYVDSLFTISIDLATEYSSISNNSLNCELVYKGYLDGGDDLILGMESVPIYYNTSFNVNNDPLNKKLKSYNFNIKTLKNINIYPTPTDQTNRLFLAITLPNSIASYSLYIANLGVYKDKKYKDLNKPFSFGNLQAKLKSIANFGIFKNVSTSNNASIGNNLIVEKDSLIKQDLTVTRNTTINDTLNVKNNINLGQELVFKSSTGVILGKLGKYGSLVANKFIFTNGDGSRAELDATSLQARYSDYAELFKCNINVNIGDIVKVSKSNIYDIDLCYKSLDYFGVVSSKPGVVLNSELNDLPISNKFKILPIGYKGIVDIKIVGKINKGECITLSKIPGVGKKSIFKLFSFAIALEFKKDKGIKLIKCVLK